jgi:asparagine N-glycosylation enzyme membrane subunit Stt3
MWTGLTVVGLSVFAFGLFAISRTLSGAFAGPATVPITITVTALAIGLTLSVVGIVATSRKGKRGGTHSTEDTRPKIAA